MTEIPPKIWFGNACRKNGFPVTDAQLNKLEQYVALLLDWNKKINLVSRKDEENIWQNHILHCAALMFKLEFPKAMKVLDIGSGGGLPGIPLKILQPDLDITLLDATQKKVNAVREMLNELRLPGISTQWGRAEEIGKRAEHRSRFSAAIARAVAPLADLVKWSRPFLGDPVRRLPQRDDGKIPITPSTLIAMKGGELEREIEQVRADKRVRDVKVIDLVFPESENITLSDKKVVLVSF
ncbi:MAG: 16S rRNA (guanine(527)-N(7))-methyltransferase RsmG [Ignavibacteriae bacterium]|nr:16S rRNA (guanine(527)-N(7))-methyltransferase RsmG [Ignavibacteriota bacterium]